MRVVAGTPATLRHRFAVAPSGAVTVTATLDDGTAVLTGEAATGNADNIYSVPIPAADLTGPDRLTVEWDAGAGHVETVLVDVAGAVFVNRAEVKASRGLSSVDDLIIERVASHVEDRIETFHGGIAWVPRYTVEAHRAAGRDRVRLDRRPVRQLRRVSVDGADQGSVDAWVVRDLSAVVYAPYVPARGALLEVGYEFGEDQPPWDLADAATQAAAQLAREHVDQHTPKRTEFAEGASWLIATASPTHGRLFGIPSVDAVIQAHHVGAGVLA